MLTRRAFHQSMLAAVATLALPRAGRAAVGPQADLWLNRLSFGADEASRTAFAALGAEGWLEAQLALPVADAGLDERLAAARLRINYEAGEDENGHKWRATDEMRPLSALTANPADLMRLVDWSQGMNYDERARPAREVIAASLIRAVHAPAQLREVMTQFWHDHFNVNSAKNEFTAAFFASHDATLRQHVFGNFRVMLGEVARSPAMLYYLNNDESRASPANENYARELLELHTLGAGNYLNDRFHHWHEVPGADAGLALGYLDLDVYEVARAFTGWSVGDGRWISEGVEAPRTGQFHYVEAWHDPYQKRILAVEFEGNAAPMADGERVLDILARHPGTASFVCEKIARRLLADAPDPGLVARLAEVFLAAVDAPDQIAQVLRALVLSPEFAATPPGKLRRPFEMLAALYRATGAEVDSPEIAFHWELARAGWYQHEYGPPTGHSDRIEAWTGASTLNRTVDLALYAHEDWFASARIEFSAADGTQGAFAEGWAARLIGDQAAGVLVGAALADLGIDPAVPVGDLSAENRRGVAVAAIALAALTPEFLLR
ncbi:Protein of unknown function DUF1800 [Rhodobacter ferrooxidans]|uniref:DUF1800 domain-containing protein n=2 Tax=Rhodobacter ferrooxidans TaxID=371731 RepID=C8S2W4_9RHOB|nr:Protein of unknown function DUF1800 [Rhodobacter sp. SW2]